MRVIEVTDLGGPDSVRVGERPEPSGDGVLVAVKAVGLSYPDLLRSRGQYQEHIEPPYVLGQELAGDVLEATAGSGFAPGDRVAGMIRGSGAGAEQFLADPATLIKLPAAISYEQGAAAVFNYQTVILALEIRGRLQAGETALVHGAAGGTGTAAIQVAKAKGARVIAVVSSDQKAEIARQAGADEVVRSDGAWKDEALALTDGQGVDVVFDPVGGDRMLDTIRSLRFGGRWVIIGFTGGSIPQIPANRLLLKNVEAVGSSLGSYAREIKDGRAKLLARVDELLRAGAIQPIVGSTFPMEQTGQALRELDERRALGKVVVTISE